MITVNCVSQCLYPPFQMVHWSWYLAFLSVVTAAAQTKTNKSPSTTVLQRIPCGLPPFVQYLPQKQAEQLREVWENYHNGSACVDEQRRTFEIVGSLTEAERAAVFEFRPEVPVDDEFDTTPAFIKMLSPEVKAGFDAIWTNSSLPDSEKIMKARKAIDDRISNLSAKSKEIYQKLMKLREEQHQILTTMTEEVAKELHGLI
ncbi:unnamed protein product [Nippostrongylus brasiliensis]|uniref:DUF148 domain-containing protein n=1 Tax=Nippostrongylus brasiliensis TaxID=27835 RepID=A0A0N4Y8N5_NIPBR|nr:unnamed protein product [Nippostrongylus brasiliensis]